MKPKYPVSIRVSGNSFVDMYFSDSLSSGVVQKIRELERFSGLQVNNQTNGIGFWITFPPIWGSDSIVEEVLSILESEGFDRDSILVK